MAFPHLLIRGGFACSLGDCGVRIVLGLAEEQNVVRQFLVASLVLLCAVNVHERLAGHEAE